MHVAVTSRGGPQIFTLAVCTFYVRCGRIDSVWEDILHLSELHGVFGTHVNWWLRCKDSKAWKNSSQA
jgi:hypothetical protein